MKIKLVVIQPTPFCNLNCRYCYLPQRSLTHHMSVPTLEQIFKRLFSAPFIEDRVSCVWHAGEPLVLSPDFYREAFHIQKRWNTQGVTVVNGFQTNATLITQEWCDFFLEHAIRIGVSIDGPAFIHDAQRVDRKNRGTFERVIKGINLLRANNIPYSMIAVVTGETVHYPDEFWHFFMQFQPTVLGLNPEEVEGANAHSSLYTDVGLAQYKSFLQRLLALNVQSQAPLAIREFNVLIRRMRSGKGLTQADTNTPMAILSFDHKGNFTTFSPELLTVTHKMYGQFTFGNVFDNTLEEMFRDEKFAQVSTAIKQGVVRCQESCEYFRLCGGGAPSNKLYENGRFELTETNACRLQIKVATDVLLEHLEERYHISETDQAVS